MISAEPPPRRVVMCKSDWPEGDDDFVVFVIRAGESDADAIVRAKVCYNKPSAEFYIATSPGDKA